MMQALVGAASAAFIGVRLSEAMGFGTSLGNARTRYRLQRLCPAIAGTPIGGASNSGYTQGNETQFCYIILSEGFV